MRSYIAYMIYEKLYFMNVIYDLLYSLVIYHLSYRIYHMSYSISKTSRGAFAPENGTNTQ